MHSTFPVAWFLCDEVDAALDVLRASHLANYMLQSSTQFIVVSHKPQVFEKAKMLCLLYQAAGSSTGCCVPVEPLASLLEEA